MKKALNRTGEETMPEPLHCARLAMACPTRGVYAALVPHP